jgi:hypothetical protein
MHSSHDVHKTNVYRVIVFVCPSTTATGHMKFGMDVMPLEATPNLYFLVPTTNNNDMADD